MRKNASPRSMDLSINKFRYDVWKISILSDCDDSVEVLLDKCHYIDYTKYFIHFLTTEYSLPNQLYSSSKIPMITFYVKPFTNIDVFFFEAKHLEKKHLKKVQNFKSL